MNIQLLFLGVALVATLTTLTTEALKKMFEGKSENIIAAVASLVLSIAVGIGYILIYNLEFNTTNILTIVALAFISWLCSMLGYDKVIQTLKQLGVKQ